jgi:hypothetical protein
MLPDITLFEAVGMPGEEWPFKAYGKPSLRRHWKVQQIQRSDCLGFAHT